MVFFLQAEDGLVLIDYTASEKSLATRLRSLQRAHGRPLILRAKLNHAAYEVERTLHRYFALQRRLGKWFQPNAELDELMSWAAKDPDATIPNLADYFAKRKKLLRPSKKERGLERMRRAIATGELTEKREGAVKIKREGICCVCEIAIEVGEEVLEVEGQEEWAHATCAPLG